MYEEIYETIKIYRGMSVDFICWVCPKLVHVVYHEHDILYIEGDRLQSIYSLFKGNVSFVLPEFNFCEYIQVTIGDSFGLADICDKKTG